MAYKQFLPAQVLTASEAQTYLMNQSVIVFASAAARTSAITLPTEGMLTYLQDVDELQVYNGSSWLTLVVTSDDESFTTSGSIIANNAGVDGGIALRQWTASSGYQSLATTNMSGNEYVVLSDGVDTFVGAGTGGSVNLRPSANSTAGAMNVTTTQTTTTGDFKISKRNPVLQIEETGGADNVDINLYQSGSSTEGLQIRYESGTGHSRIKNIYSLGHLYLHSANNTNTGIRIESNGYTYANNGYNYSSSGQMIGSSRLIAQGYAQTSGAFSVGATWTTLFGFTVDPATLRQSYVGVLFEYSCYMNGTGAHRSRILIDRGGTYSVYERYRYFNTAYQHQGWSQHQMCLVPNSGSNFVIYCQVWAASASISFDGNDAYGFLAYSA